MNDVVVISGREMEQFVNAIVERVTAAIDKKLSEAVPAPSGTMLDEKETVCLKEIVALTGISKTSWWEGVKQGRYPKPLEGLGHVRRWAAKDIRALLSEAKRGAA